MKPSKTDEMWVGTSDRDTCLHCLANNFLTQFADTSALDRPIASPKFKEFYEFSKFRTLPTEIRLHIWGDTIQPQDIALDPNQVHPWGKYRYRFNCTFPAALTLAKNLETYSSPDTLFYV